MSEEDPLRLPVDVTLVSVGIVVDDLQARMADYAELLGITDWTLVSVDADAGSLRGRSLRGSTANAAEGVTAGGVTFQLVQPGAGDSLFAQFLIQRGPGVCHLTLAVVDDEQFEALRDVLRSKGVEAAQTMDFGGKHQVLFDTRAHLGGWYLAVDVVREAAALSGRHVTVDRSSSAPVLPVSVVHHFGVAARDAFATMDGFGHVFGYGSWDVYRWGSEGGMLTDADYNGQPVDHAYIGATGWIGEVGFEVVQSTSGPTHYKEDFLDHVGEGIHHMYLAEYDSGVTREEFRGWAHEHGLARVMGGLLCNGDADFEYVDARDRLGGLVVEGSGMLNNASADVFVPNFVVSYAGSAS